MLHLLKYIEKEIGHMQINKRVINTWSSTNRKGCNPMTDDDLLTATATHELYLSLYIKALGNKCD